jgi:hypothetical protein
MPGPGPRRAPGASAAPAQRNGPGCPRTAPPLGLKGAPPAVSGGRRHAWRRLSVASAGCNGRALPPPPTPPDPYAPPTSIYKLSQYSGRPVAQSRCVVRGFSVQRAGRGGRLGAGGRAAAGRRPAIPRKPGGGAVPLSGGAAHGASFNSASAGGSRAGGCLGGLGEQEREQDGGGAQQCETKTGVPGRGGCRRAAAPPPLKTTGQGGKACAPAHMESEGGCRQAWAASSSALHWRIGSQAAWLGGGRGAGAAPRGWGWQSRGGLSQPKGGIAGARARVVGAPPALDTSVSKGAAR